MGRASLAIFILLLLSISLSPSSSASTSEPQVQITRVCPAYPGEFVTISNIGPDTDIGGWTLTDGEGGVMMRGPLLLRSGESITWTDRSGSFRSLYPDERTLDADSPEVLLTGNMKLADTGDDLVLLDANGRSIDSLYYGASEPSPPWNGPAVPCKKGQMLERTASDMGFASWETVTPGSYSFSSGYFEAEASPVIYPDGGLPALVREVDAAQERIRLATYILENWTLARHLAAASSRGVQVTLLLEGQPVGGISDKGAAVAYYLNDSGASVWTMRSSESFRRYDYLHAKYAIFDDERLMVCSENMADSSFSSNRGWGVVLESQELAGELLRIFERDMACTGLDVFPLDLSVPRVEGHPGRLLQNIPDETATYVTKAALLSSPFSLRESLIISLNSAKARVYVQQLRIDEGWLQGEEVLNALFDAAGRGVDVKVHLDSALGTEDGNERVAAEMNRLAEENGWSLECRLAGPSAPFERLHNKGVIIDDSVMVGSANWVDGSMEENREIALSLRSSELAEVYADWFLSDWKGDSSPPSIELPWHYLEARSDEVIVLDASGCYDPSGIGTVQWDLDGDGGPDLSGPIQTVFLQEGTYNINVTITDTLGNTAIDTMTVIVLPDDDRLTLLLYAPIPILMAVVIVGSRNRRV